MNKFDQNKGVKHSNPITIDPANFRRRSASISSSSSSSASGSSPDTPGQTPILSPMNAQHVNIPSPSTSPILSYFLAQSPSKTTSQANITGTYPFKRKFGTVPAFEEEPESEVPVAAHARRATAVVPGRFLQNQPLPESHHERGTNLLRRLSLSSALSKVNTQSSNTQSPILCSPPPNSAVIPSPDTVPSRKPGRSATICNDGRKPRRAPSPMGERILKGHFDGFN